MGFILETRWDWGLISASLRVAYSVVYLEYSIASWILLYLLFYVNLRESVLLKYDQGIIWESEGFWKLKECLVYDFFNAFRKIFGGSVRIRMKWVNDKISKFLNRV
jgi:hypothetical protein